MRKLYKERCFSQIYKFYKSDFFSFTVKTLLRAKPKIAQRIASKTITSCDLDLTTEERRAEEKHLTEKNILEIACQESKILLFLKANAQVASVCFFIV